MFDDIMIEVAIFAYNRPDYLKNAVDSVLRHIPGARLRIYDDCSDEPAMLAYLSSLGEIVVRREVASHDRHGGLYANMNRALNGAERPLLLMLQDDMQVVRQFDAKDLEALDRLFGSNPKMAFVCPLFMKADRKRRFRRELVPDLELRAYISPPVAEMTSKNCLSYFDVHIAHVDRLRAAGWQYLQEGEGQIRDSARVLFGAMPMLGDPCVFFCPEVPFFRHREQSLAARIASKYIGRHVKSFVDMTESDTTKLRSRDLAVWPFAEDFLTPNDANVVRPFVYKDVNARLWLYALHKIEQWVRSKLTHRRTR
jgi:glycosyltransferase involved in cell wall biosynthesis